MVYCPVTLRKTLSLANLPAFSFKMGAFLTLSVQKRLKTEAS